MKEYVGIRQAVKGGYIKCEVGGVADFLYPTSKLRRGRVQGGGQICPAITSQNFGVCKVERNLNTNDRILSDEELDKKIKSENIIKENKYYEELFGQDSNTDSSIDWDNTEYRIRKLTPRECGNLMDVEEKDIDVMLSTVSNTQAYKMYGNSIVVSVLCAIFSQLNIQGIKPWNDRTIEEKRALTALEVNKVSKAAQL